jgi:hypothetical protein
MPHHGIFSVPRRTTTNTNKFNFPVDYAVFSGSKGTKPELQSTSFFNDSCLNVFAVSNTINCEMIFGTKKPSPLCHEN